jgi:hypothetical protein
MNHSLRTADLATHVRIVAISLTAGIVMILSAVHAHRDEPDTSKESGGIIKASRQFLYSERTGVSVH